MEHKSAKIIVDSYEYIITYIDSTHFEMRLADSKYGYGAIYHIAQVSHQPYYDDLKKWLYNELEIDGNIYD